MTTATISANERPSPARRVSSSTSGAIEKHPSEEPRPRRLIGHAAWLAPVVAEVNRLMALPNDWDTLGGTPLEPWAAREAIDFLIEYALPETPAPIIAPWNDGGVHLEWRARELLVEVDISPGESQTLYYRDHALGREEDRPIEPSDRGLVSLSLPAPGS